MRLRQNLLLLLIVIFCFVVISITHAAPLAQVIVSATPVPINLPSPLPFIPQENDVQAAATATRTPTPLGPVVLEALTEANVRSQPDPESERLGSIRVGDVYPVIGRYFRWYQFQYEQSPSGTGWVFDELVQIIGDEASIPDLSATEAPTLDAASIDASATVAVILQAPGGDLTATALGAQIPLPVPGQQQSSASTLAPTGEAVILPTFTFPPNIALIAPTFGATVALDNPEATITPSVDSGFVLPSNVPPILPIIVLGAFGILGLIVSTYRR